MYVCTNKPTENFKLTFCVRFLTFVREGGEDMVKIPFVLYSTRKESRQICNSVCICVPVTKKCMCEDSTITLHVCCASLSCILAGTRHSMCVYIPSTIQYMCRGSLLDGRDSCVTSFITQNTLSCRSKLAPPLTNSTTTSVLPSLAASMSAVSPSCVVTIKVWVN